MDAAHERRRHLGEILVEEGFITPDALAGALEVQATQQRPLGELVVELGLVSPGVVANALADQHGGILRTEYGISAGFRPTVVRAAEPEAAAATEVEERPANGIRVVAAVGKPEAETVGVEPRLEPQFDRPDPLEPWRAAVAERDGLLRQLSATVRARDEQLASLSMQIGSPDGTGQHRIAELEAEQADLRAEVDALRLRISEAASTAEARGHELVEAHTAHAKLLEANAALEALRAELAAAGSAALELQEAHNRQSSREAAQEQLAAELDAVRSEAAAAVDRMGMELGEARRELGEARASQAQLAEAKAALEALRAELAAAGSGALELEEAQTQLAAELAAVRVEAAAAADSMGAELGEARRALGRALADGEAARAALDARTQELADTQRSLSDAQAELEALAQSQAAPVAEAEPERSHVLLVPGRKGWELVERDGPAPAPGEAVELDAAYVVARLGPSPLPGGAGTCAFLERA